MKDNKYMVTIRDKAGKSLRVDVYDVLAAFPITCPALQHLTKKALFAGRRGHKDQLHDLMDIRASADRAIELYHSRKIADESENDLEVMPKAKTPVFIYEKLPNEMPKGINIGNKFVSKETGSIVIVTEVSESGRLIKYKATQCCFEGQRSTSVVAFLERYKKYEGKECDKFDFFPLEQGQKRAKKASMDTSQHVVINYLGSTHSQIIIYGNEPEMFTRLNSDIIEQYPWVIK